MRDSVHHIIQHLRQHDGEDCSQVWQLCDRGGWLYEPLKLFVTSAERGTILEAVLLP